MAGRVPSLLVLLLVFPSSCLAFRSPLSVFKRFKETTRPFSSECLGTTRPIIPIDSSDFALDIRMPGVIPKQASLTFSLNLTAEGEKTNSLLGPSCRISLIPLLE
ncbi:PREDICTED: peptidyl-glycine alpha-amidating monooxygenase-like [Colobus angolensis palliatus]|uniref:peptidyl-glycine alpha-amidating monooxygenase-like n=1 Tax=Colobus angolensis palliatus TaxID=336983 RepID=UPI0005F38FA8|nr:PREDICTED: peptidyl-glycine alpha-amidating monooxygenase-like [Colobus angolensis palliatus]XP_011799704.1 PREDICTED: peptidyl-glycine alpha-amidating monooxygenase-like [Colobus angolensis palliatus]